MSVNIEYVHSPTFELVMHTRDRLGQPTEKQISHRSDDANSLFEFWSRNKGRSKRRKPKTDKGAKVEKNV